MIRTPDRRMTRQRRVILEELIRLKNHPTVDELYTQVRSKLPRISLGTVYRNLQVLARDGRIRCLADGSRKRYDGTLHDHYHVRCIGCGKVADVPAGAVRNLSDSVAGSNDFKIIGFKVEFLGICPECEAGDKEVEIERETLGEYKMIADSRSCNPGER